MRQKHWSRIPRRPLLCRWQKKRGIEHGKPIISRTDATLFQSAIRTQGVHGTANDLKGHTVQFGNHVYEHFEEKQTWSEAFIKDCEIMGGEYENDEARTD